jgi:cation transport ATPase
MGPDKICRMFASEHPNADAFTVVLYGSLANTGNGHGTDVAVESADVVLVKNSLFDVVRAVNIGKATIRNVRQNLFWAIIYNTIGIPIAAGVLHLFGGPLLSPMIAAAAMSLSSVSVVTNALRLNIVNTDKEIKDQA